MRWICSRGPGRRRRSNAEGSARDEAVVVTAVVMEAAAVVAADAMIESAAGARHSVRGRGGEGRTQ